MIKAGDDEYVLYDIGKHENRYCITKVDKPIKDCIFKGDLCYRKARRPKPCQNWEEKGLFTDSNFPFKLEVTDKDSKGQPLKLRRLFDVYEREFNLFDNQFFTPSFVDYEQKYPSFVGELIGIDRDYIQTIFITQRVKKLGYYEYFVRRNGEYYVQYIDDQIPVHGLKQVPIWGLSFKEPWQLLLMKAWIKEKKSIRAVLEAGPFEFLEAFGMPGYRTLSLKKEMKFLVTSHIHPASKQTKEARIPLNRKGYITIGKTRNNDKVSEIGLRKNSAAYCVYCFENKVNISKINMSKIGDKSVIEGPGKSIVGESMIDFDDPIYKVGSTVECRWVGSMSVVQPSQINNSLKPAIHQLNLEREFLTRYSEISQVFSQFYISPEWLTKFNGKFLQDSIRISSLVNKPHIFFIEVENVVEGFLDYLNINVQLQLQNAILGGVKGNKKRWSSIKCFLAYMAPQKDKNQPPNYSKATYENFDYVKGYHKSSNNFMKLEKSGTYCLYVKIDSLLGEKVDYFNININTNVRATDFSQKFLSQVELGNLMNSTFMNFARRKGFKTYLDKPDKNEIVYLGNMFDEIGFGFVAIETLPQTKKQIALRGFTKVLKENQLQISKDGNYTLDAEGNLCLFSKPEGKIVILEHLNRHNIVKEDFPPKNSFTFFEI